MEYPQLKIDPAFIEEAVFLALQDREGRLKKEEIEAFHKKREQLYQSTLSVEEKDEPFQELYRRYFRQWGLDKHFVTVLGEYPVLRQPNIVVFIKRVWGKKQEDCELYVQKERKTIYIGLQVARILKPRALKQYLRHELMRMADMLEPRFQYSPRIDPGGRNGIEDNIIKDRFRVLWDLYIETRLRNAGREDKRLKRLGEGFPFWSREKCERVLKKMESCEDLTHMDLLGWAGESRQKGAADKGAFSCSLCGFTGFKTSDASRKKISRYADDIIGDYPEWKPSDEVCDQCIEIYEAKQKMVV